SRSAVASPEQSSTTTSSSRESVWRRTLATAVPSVAAASCVASTTETRGVESVFTASGPDADATVPPVPGPELPSFDLVVASVDRTEELSGLLRSLERQTHAALRVLLVDQNGDDRLAPLLARHPALAIERLRAPRGLSRARNAALALLAADVVAFPDDDCAYPDDLLERVARRLAAEPSLDGVTGRAEDAGGARSPSWPLAPAPLTLDNVWNRANSHTLFLRRAVVERTGSFDEALG